MTFEQVLDIATKFNGVIGAVIGSMSTLIITHILKNTGRVYVNIAKAEKKYMRQEQGKQKYAVYDINQATESDFVIDVEFYNSSEIFKSVKNFIVQFYDEKNQPFYNHPLNDKKMRNGQFKPIDHPADYYNLEPKKLQKLSFCFFMDHDIEVLKHTHKIGIEYGIVKRKSLKTKTVKIKNIDFKFNDY
ncbi:hypothetical protein [Domibacillus epiphyticus]|uniref:Uncharacterized protein n=1 Tax=Domibacillus epiphyticus TaxID=1714355 RepID=A0A1V2A7R8_9BACI|nr:hypothetical protein [Domibacillus epiphyticus]OMP67045.1 hypothetical protein BTO28_08650 [Domibacillus epiphyticus]